LAAPPARSAPPVYDSYRIVLLAFVDADGLVDYAGLKAQRSDLDDFVVYLERVNPQEYAAWSDPDKIAFWINAYNALTLRAVIDHYPINPPAPNGSYPRNSIRQIPGVFDLSRVHVMGEEITIQYIETKHLGGDFNDPRVHMALVCATTSAPKLRNEPYAGATLHAQLDSQVRDFLKSPRNFRMDPAKDTVHVSEIFHWYANDFARGPGPDIIPTGPADLAARPLRKFTSVISGSRTHFSRACACWNIFRTIGPSTSSPAGHEQFQLPATRPLRIARGHRHVGAGTRPRVHW
jgi:hypothetical protein